jgi:hypothetical protein
MTIDSLDSIFICKAHFSGGNPNDLSVFPVELYNVVVPGSTKISDQSPKAVGSGKQRTWDLAQRMEEEVVQDAKEE